MSWIAICERNRTGMGRNENKTYINVVTQIRQISNPNAQDFVDKNSTHPWADPAFNEFIVDLTEQEAIDIRDNNNSIFYDGTHNNPRWQQQVASSGNTIAAKAFGSWADPENSGTTWVLNRAIPDDRWIVRLFTLDPVLNPGSAVHVASEEFDEQVAGSSVTRFMQLFTKNDVASTTNAQNQRTDIGGKLLDFDFTTGVAEIKFGTDVPGIGQWNSNHRYRIVGPLGEKEYIWKVFGNTLRIIQE